MIHPSQIQPGSRVRLHLSIKLADGTVAESTFDDQPMEFEIGDGTLIGTLEVALFGMRAGEQQRLELRPEQAYGGSDPTKVHYIARDQFSSDLELEPGVILGFTTPDGEEVPGIVLVVEDDRVRMDFNHPLAGKPIIFECEILDVQPPGNSLDPRKFPLPPGEG